MVGCGEVVEDEGLEGEEGLGNGGVGVRRRGGGGGSRVGI